jgi:hypothetical protein
MITHETNVVTLTCIGTGRMQASFTQALVMMPSWERP